MKRGLLLILGLIIGNAVSAQEFAFAPNQNGNDSGEKVAGYKKTIAQKVFNDLLLGRGDFRMQTPVLVMTKQERYIAYYKPDQVQITLEEKAYDVCTTFGKDSLNALAALLSHELTHYYEKHDWSRHFARENQGMETARQVENLKEGLKQEAQADYIGGFMAFSVGYNTYGIMPKLLKALYRDYELPEDLPGYPTLTERLQMVDNAMVQLRDLQIVFETANLLTILGNYADANTYYRNILQTYQSREIYNNAGVNAALAGLALVEPGEMPYVLPLELDPKSRLFGIKSNDQEKEARKNNLFKTAQEQFERAILLDEHYATAYLNKACVHTLRGEWDDADYVIRKGKKQARDASGALDFEVLEGIIAALQKDDATASRHFEQAKSQGSALAQTNLNVLQGAPKPGIPTMPASKGLEEIEQFPLADFLTTPTTDREVKVAEKVFCGLRQFKNSRLFIHYANGGKSYVLVQETQPDYAGRTLQGIALDSPQDKVVAAYGKPPKTLALPAGSVWVYPEINLFFRFNAQSKVESWAVYRKSDP